MKGSKDRLYHYLTHKILETPGARLHAIVGIETHIHIAARLQPNLLVSVSIGKLKGRVRTTSITKSNRKALEWQRGYGIRFVWYENLHWVDRLHQ